MSAEITIPAVSALDFSSPQHALDFFARHGAAIDDDVADGVESLRLVSKDSLLGVPFLAVQWRFNESENGSFASVEFMTNDGTRGVFNDGGSGIARQLETLTAERTATGHKFPQAGRLIRGGLRVSRYTFKNEKGKDQQAETYYLSY